MVNYNDPLTVAQEYATMVKFWHLWNGIYIWEFFTTLNYEWEVFRGHRTYRWTIWVYSIARLGTLVGVAMDMINMENTAPINCQIWVTFQLIFAYLASAASSLLIVLRIIAIWNKQKFVFAMAMGMWVTDVAFLVDATVRLRSEWSPEAKSCALLNFETTTLGIVGVLVTDIVLLVTMLIGLLRMRVKAGGAFGLASLLWKQGLVWLLIVTVAEVPPATFMLLNLNVVLASIPQMPCNIVVTIAATRMYRALTNFTSSEISQEPRGTWGSGRKGLERQAHSGQTGPFPLSRMEVSVRTDFEQYPTSHASPSASSFIIKDPQGGERSHDVTQVNFNVDVVESCPEK